MTGAYDPRSMPGTVLIFSGGDTLTSKQAAALPKDAVVIAADSGIDRARDAGRDVDIAVGDFDSVSAQGLAAVEQAGADVRRHNAVKDETDLELAIAAASDLDPDRIVFAAMSGGRPDHELAGILLLSGCGLPESGADIDVILDGARVSVIYGRRTLTGHVGDLVSLVPVAGDVCGVTTNGLEYPLVDEDLTMGSGRGVSNIFAAPMAVVSIDKGVLFAIKPDPSHASDEA